MSSAQAALPAGVAEAIALGDCPRVFAELPSPNTDEARLVVGHCLVRANQPDRARPLLEAVTAEPYRSWARYRLAEAEGEALTASRADALLGGITLPGPDGARITLLRARAMALEDSEGPGRDLLRGLLEGESAAEARFWLGEAAVRDGRTEPGVAALQRTWASHAVGPWDERAAERLAGLGRPVPSLKDEAGRSLAKDRVKTLRDANMHAEALELVRALREVEPGVIGPKEWAWTLFRGRAYPEAVPAFVAICGEEGTLRCSAEDAFHFALATSRVGEHDLAAARYRRLMQDFPDDKRADEASYKLGYLEWDRQRWAEAEAAFTAHLKARPQSRFADEALWFMGWAAWFGGDRDRAVVHWKRLTIERPQSGLLDGAVYWQARAAGLAGDAAAEKAGLESVITRFPVSGYAWWAAERLGRTFPQRPIVPPPAWPAAWGERREIREAEALLAVGYVVPARHVLLPLIPELRSADLPTRLAASHALLRAGAYQEAKKLVEASCVSPWKGGDPAVQQICTPRPEAGLVDAVARRTGLHPLVPYGIMTAESGLDPTVTSIAGARGLMQLMPVEAERLHGELFPKRPYSPDDLYSAPYNATLGTWELGTKLQALDGVLAGDDLSAAIAAYNGGEEAVRRWVAGHGAPPEADLFAETIGFTETRRYVKRVLGYTMAYRWVYGDPAPASTNP